MKKLRRLKHELCSWIGTIKAMWYAIPICVPLWNVMTTHDPLSEVRFREAMLTYTEKMKAHGMYDHSIYDPIIHEWLTCA